MGYIKEYLAECPEELLYQEYLEECVKEAVLYRGRRMYCKDHLWTEYIGTVRRGVWLVDIYEDREGNYWTDDRVMIGKWIITGLELVSGVKEPDNTFWRHTGIDSDWDKVYEEYGGIPPDWERLAGGEQEAGNGNNHNDAGYAAAFGRVEAYKRAV